ncbi:MAG: trypsin-like peptidase domain-containing protein [Planctomycetota bacterium]
MGPTGRGALSAGADVSENERIPTRGKARGSGVGRRWVIGWAVLALAQTARAEEPARYSLADLKTLENAFVALAEQVRPVVVAIRTYRVISPKEIDALVKLPVNQGTGFIIGAEGYIATNRHVLEESSLITVILFDGSQHEAEIKQADARSDLAVIKIDAKDLPTARLGDSAGLKVNQWAFAVGNPFGTANEDGKAAVTMGVISALGREMTHRIQGNPQIQYYGNLIQTSAPINPGSSGGPLFNLDGEVIGVVTAIETSSGVSEGAGFAIPMDGQARRVLETLRAGHAVRYGFLGIRIADVEAPPSESMVSGPVSRGARLVSVDPSGPAGTAGLVNDDVVIEFNGVRVVGSDHLVRLVGFSEIGSKVEVTYLRKQVKRKTVVTVGDRFELMGVANPDG